MAPTGETQAVAFERSVRWLPWLTAGQRLAVNDVWRAFGLSRGLVWLVGIATVLVAGAAAQTSPRLDSLFLTVPFESDFANLLVAPAARFDAAWYLEIATFGYDVQARAAFFPLYPGLVALLTPLIGSAMVAAIAISIASSITALYLLHRLVTLDHPPVVAGATVALVACSPAAISLSAVYTEGLFLALSVGSVYAARLGRWRAAGLIAMLAAATRSAGVLVVVALIALYLYGPRADRPPDRDVTGWRPRYRLRHDVAWIAMAPVGLGAYLAYLGLATGDPFTAFTAQSEWDRVFAPLAGIALGLRSALSGIVELVTPALSGRPPFDGYLMATGSAVLDVVLFACLCLTVWLVRESARRLPPAYVAYSIASLALPLSMPAVSRPLMSLPRFALVAFPLWLALALWALERRALGRVLAVSCVLLAVSTGLFSAWASAP